MTKKKRQRKEERNELHGHPHNPNMPALSDSYIELESDPGKMPTDLAELGLPPDMRAMERTIAQFNRLMAAQDFDSEKDANAFLNAYAATHSAAWEDAPPPRTPLEKAQEVMYDAFDSDDPRKRMRLAKKALQISPDCADAHVLLAEEASTSAEDALVHYQDGVEAGKRALGEEFIDAEAGNFWVMLETRPYMRALDGLASCHWVLGDRTEAIEIYEEMLRLNPNDNQGIRDVLADCLLAAGNDDKLQALLDQYKDDPSAKWTYTRALLQFRRDGDSRKATSALRKATKGNPYVPMFLLGRLNMLSMDMPQLIGVGDASEAVTYFAQSHTDWLSTRGAIDWVRDNVDEKTLLRLEQELG